MPPNFSFALAITPPGSTAHGRRSPVAAGGVAIALVTI
jgi:hypothetical protein